MKIITFITLTLLATFSFAQPGLYKDGFEEWENESKTNKRLLPRYGHLTKTSGEINSDSAFIKEIMSQPKFKTRHEASNHLIGLGFQYFYQDDLKAAMYRFNQAYLLDTLNTDIFWGYGAIYMRFGMLGLAADQYKTGLRIDSTNTHLLTDLGTMFQAQYYRLEFPESLDSAIYYMNKSFEINSKDQNTLFKLSVCHWNKGDCKNAWKFYNLCKAQGGQPITEEYTKDLKAKCKK
jgi:tetratricopeptide (TPR) repeat protein